MFRTAPTEDLADDIRDVMEVAGRLAAHRPALRAWIEAGRSRATLPHVAMCASCSGPEVESVYKAPQEGVIDFRSRYRDAKKKSASAG